MRKVGPIVAVIVVAAAVFIWSATRDDGGSRVVTYPNTTSDDDLPPVQDTGIDWSSPAELPPPTRDDFRSEFVSDVEGYRFWPRSGRVTPSTAYRFDTGHCGLSFMTDFDGSFWHPVIGPDAVAPDFFFNQDVGAIALVDFNRAVYRSSTGVEVELERLPGPVVTQPCV